MTARTSVASSGRPMLRRPSPSGPSQSVVAVRRNSGHNCGTALSRSSPNIRRYGCPPGPVIEFQARPRVTV